jgi:ParB-like chromosome segregation protein Spo0J
MTTPWKYDPTKELEHHPLADLCPQMSKAEYDALAKDVLANGLQVPIVIFEGKILDGRHRYKAMFNLCRHKLNNDCFRVYEGTNPVELVLSLNVNRRHLTTSQRAMIAARIATGKLGSNQYNAVGLTIEKAANSLNVSKASVENAKVVLEKGANEVIAKVQSGKLKIGKAKEIVSKPLAEQIAEVNKTKGQGKGKSETKPKAKTEFQKFVEQWQNFGDVEHRGFVQRFKEQIGKLLDEVSQQEAMSQAAE